MLLDTSEITIFWLESYDTLFIQSIMAGSGSRTFTLTDAPPKPEVVKMTLKEKSMWGRFKKTCQGLSPEKLMAAFDTEKQRITKNVKERGHITEEEAELLNKTTQENTKKVLEDITSTKNSPGGLWVEPYTGTQWYVRGSHIQSDSWFWEP